MKNYIGISRDHTGSMQSIARPAMNDYNDNIAVIREAAAANDIDTIVSVVKCGHGSSPTVTREIVNSNVARLAPLTSYEARATGTPLWDSVGELIDILRSVPDAADPEVTFLVMVITDGYENASHRWNARSIAAEIQRLQATDRWSFAFRVPRGGTRTLTALGISEGNVLEWDQTQRGVEQASAATRAAMTQFYSDRKAGIKSTGRFYANLVQVPASEIKANLVDISHEVNLFSVNGSTELRSFVEAQTYPRPLLKGAAFYQLSKTEDVQDHKKIAVRDQTTGQVFSGAAARSLLGLPLHGDIRLSPGNNGNFDVFVQSTSVNRKLVPGTKLLYWPNVGKAYLEGASAR